MKKLILLFLGLIALAVYLGWTFFQKGLTIDISQRQLQAQLSQKFPVEKNYLIASATLTDPQVILKNDSDRVFIGCKAAVSVPTQRNAAGSAMFSGNVIYDPNRAEFLLADLRLEDLQIQGISSPVLDKTKGILGEIAAQILNRLPVYKLEDQRAQKLAKHFLKSMQVRDGKLRVTFGM